MKIEYIQNVNAVQSLSDLIMELRIDPFKRLAKKWKKDGKRLWIYSASGTLHVMMHGDTNYNPTPEFTQYGGSNIENSITIIDGIPNDGGDW